MKSTSLTRVLSSPPVSPRPYAARTMKMGTGYARKFQTFVYQVENQFGELVISRREPGDFALNPNNFLFRKSFTVGYLNGGWSTVQPIDHSLPSDVGKNMDDKSRVSNEI